MKTFSRIAVLTAVIAIASCQSTTTSSAAAEGPTAVSDCHLHGIDEQFCVADGEEWEVTSDIDVANAPEEYTDCHLHGEELHCTGDGLDVSLASASAEEEDLDHVEDAASSNSTSVEEITEVTGCHPHDDVLFCFAGEDEWEVISDVDVASAPDSYTGCHAHDEELHCTGDGAEVTLAATTDHSEDHVEGEEDHTHTEDAESTTATESAGAGETSSAAEEQTEGNAAPAIGASLTLVAVSAVLAAFGGVL